MALVESRSSASNGQASQDIFKEVAGTCKAIAAQFREALLCSGHSVWCRCALCQGHGDVTPPPSNLVSTKHHNGWQQEMKTIQKALQPPKLIIGVFGPTGAGKSSLLNCLLGEEDVLPTSSMRACTTCVTEISFHASSLYSAQVTFLDQTEYNTLIADNWNDLLDEDGRLLPLSQPGRADRRTDHGAAQLSIESLLGTDVLRQAGVTLEALLGMEGSYSPLLGTTVSIEHADKAEFRKELSQYVASNANSQDGANPSLLAKLCCIQHNWKVLSAGAVLADLPGTLDSNAARGKVAEQYVKECQSMWIVCPTSRAADDCAAKDLLDESLKTQLIMDGKYGNITWVTTMTDNINATETIDSLALPDGHVLDGVCHHADVSRRSFASVYNKVHNLQDIWKEQNNRVKSDQKAVTEGKKSHSQLCKRLADLESDMENGGKTKRRRIAKAEPDAENRHVQPEGNGHEDHLCSAELVVSDDEDVDDQITKTATIAGSSEPVTNPAWRVLAAKQAEAQRKLDGLKTTLLQSEHQRSLVEQKQATYQRNLACLCASARNHATKEKLRQTFADGMAETAQAAGRGDSGFQLDLPVFCTSARNAHKLEGRYADEMSQIFSSMDQTDIPQLRHHVKSLTEGSRRHAAKIVATQVSQLIEGAGLTLINADGQDITAGRLVKQAYDREIKTVKRTLVRKLEAWQEAATSSEAFQALSNQLVAGADKARDEAKSTVKEWNSLRWQSYRATCQRQGTFFSRSSGSTIKFNDDLIQPLIDTIQNSWSTLFNTAAPEAMRELVEDVISCIARFLDRMKAATADLSLHDRVQRACSQVQQRQKSLHEDLKRVVDRRMSESQKNLSRHALEDSIKARMEEVYDKNAGERGRGSLVRMQQNMLTHIEQVQVDMFALATQSLQEQITNLFTAVTTAFRQAVGRVESGCLLPFSALWDRPVGDSYERKQALCRLREMNITMQAVCSKVGAPVLDIPEAPPTQELIAPAGADGQPQAADSSSDESEDDADNTSSSSDESVSIGASRPQV